MGTTYTSTIEVRCWKEHTCICCGGVYTYPFLRKVSGRGNTADRASQNARVVAARVMEREVDMQPCPTCGVYQPDMVGQRRAGQHRRVVWIALIAFLVIVILAATDAIQTNAAIWVAVFGCAVAAVVHWRIDTADPNRDTAANLQVAAQRVASGVITHQPGQRLLRGEDLMPSATTFGSTLARGMLLFAVLLATAPELFRITRHWPLNPDCYSPVVGPGDQPRIYMTEQITSIKGYWRGSPKAVVYDAASAGKKFAVIATTEHNDWGSSISAKSSEKNSKKTPWVRVALPDDPDLAGKSLMCDIDLEVAYPAAVDSSSFRTYSSNLRRSVQLHLAASIRAGEMYNGWWWKGTVLAMGMVSACGLLLIRSARQFQREAKPARVLVPAQPQQPAAGVAPGTNAR